jgi:hypothetical protein
MIPGITDIRSTNQKNRVPGNSASNFSGLLNTFTISNSGIWFHIAFSCHPGNPSSVQARHFKFYSRRLIFKRNINVIFDNEPV